MNITFPVKIVIPGGMINTPYGPTERPDVVETVTATITIDALTQADLQALVAPGSPNTHLSPTQLGAQYSITELSGGLQARIAAGGN